LAIIFRIKALFIKLYLKSFLLLLQKELVWKLAMPLNPLKLFSLSFVLNAIRDIITGLACKL
jgi:hypothetical protein